MSDLESASLVKILESFAAFALVAGILIAVSDTRAFPLAFGILIIAFLYWGLNNSSTLFNFGHVVNRAGQIASGSSQPGVS